MLAMYKAQCGLRLCEFEAELDLGRKSSHERLRSQRQSDADDQSRLTF